MLFFPTTDEDVAYFRSQGYTGSLNDMHYKALGDLGYTGSLNDRIHAYLVSEYGSFYEAMRDLRNGTSVFSLRSYTINGFDPALVFDFKGNYFRKVATDSTFAASITHTRASSATMVNSSGNLVTVGNNVPRTGHHVYNGSAWVNEGILHESEARTNLCNHSDNPANWLSNPSGSFTFTAAQAVGSDGTLSLTKVAIGNTSTTPHELYTSHSSINPALGMTLSAELKNGNQRYVMLRQFIDANDWFAVTFDLVTGVVTQESFGSTGSVSIRSSGVIDLSNGLYRCWVSYIGIGNTSAAGFPTIDAVSSGTPTLASNGTESYSGTVGTHFYLGKMQLEQGATPSSYIPTSGSAATRAADLLTVPAANLPYDSTNMSIQMNGKMTYSDDQLQYQAVPYQWLSNAVNFIRSTLNTQSGRTGQLILFQRQGTSGQDAVSSSLVAYAAGVNVPFNFAARHGSTFINGAHEGTLLTANTTPTALPDLSAADLNLGGQFMGTIGQFRMWNEDLTDAGIVEAST